MSTHTQQSTAYMRLPSGRVIEYATYGKPDGFPVVFFHGFLGGQHQAAFMHDAAKKHNLRLIAPNRPGSGQTGIDPEENLLQATNMFVELLKQLNINKFSIIGFSTGSAYALALAYLLPRQVSRVFIAGPFGPLNNKRNLRDLNLRHKIVFKLSSLAPSATARAINGFSRLLCFLPEGATSVVTTIFLQTEPNIPPNAEIRKVAYRDLRSIFCAGSLPGPGLVQEMNLMSNWGFAPNEVPAHIPFIVWHGRQDNVVSYVLGRRLARQLPRAQFCLKDGSHLSATQNVDEVLSLISPKEVHRLTPPPPTPVSSPDLSTAKKQ